MERAREEKEAHGEIETEHPGYLGCQDTYYVGNIKGVGRIYQQTFIDSYSKVTLVKLYDRKHAITAADMLNDRVLPWFEQQGVALLRILTDRGSEFCGNRERHEYALYLDLENIEHSCTKAKSPQTNGICERFHQTIQNEFYASAFRRKLTPADAKAIDKAFREYKDAEQALHKAFLYRRPIEEIGSDIRTFQEKDASWASLREKFYQR